MVILLHVFMLALLLYTALALTPVILETLVRFGYAKLAGVVIRLQLAIIYVLECIEETLLE